MNYLIIFEGFSLKSNQDEVEIGLVDVILFCRKYWKILVALPLCGALLVILVMSRLPERFQASAIMLITPSGVANNGPTSTALIASTLQGDEVMKRVAKQLEPAKDIGTVNATVGKDGSLEIKAESPDAAKAVRLANTAVRVGKELVLEQGLTPFSRQWSQMRGQLAMVQAEQERNQVQLAQLIPGGLATLDESTRRQLQAMAWHDVQFVYAQGDGAQASTVELPSLPNDNGQTTSAKHFSPEQWKLLRNYYFDTVLIDVLQKRIMLIRPQVEHDVQIAALAKAASPATSGKKSQYLIMSVFAGLILALLIGLVRELWPTLQAELRCRLEK
ncbi:hypothetical protein [Aquitalea aquatilis]|uniref:hypothetical protein n=1 Tax=Aquitalea aquatilis TaxID=1537400 RepID=UPI0010BD6C8A|nr:hypothetical protein [Aquitalea aquatilis]